MQGGGGSPTPTAVTAAEFQTALQTALQAAQAPAIALAAKALELLENVNEYFTCGGTCPLNLPEGMTEPAAQEAQQTMANAVSDTNIQTAKDNSSGTQPNVDVNVNVQIPEPLDVSVINEPTVHVLPEEVAEGVETGMTGWGNNDGWDNVNDGEDPTGPEKRDLMAILQAYWDGLESNEARETFTSSLGIENVQPTSVLCIGLPDGIGTVGANQTEACTDFASWEPTITMLGNFLYWFVCAYWLWWFFRG